MNLTKEQVAKLKKLKELSVKKPDNASVDHSMAYTR